MENQSIRQFAAARGLRVRAVLLACLLTGCATPWEKSALLKDNTPSVAGVQGPQERSLRNWMKKKDGEGSEARGNNSLKPIPGTKEYEAALKIFNEAKELDKEQKPDEAYAKYEESRKAFKAVRKKKEFKKSEIREDALFMEAEASWQQDHYATAHDAYAVLLKDFPSTRHLNVVSERLFKIGRLWLDFPEVASLNEIRQVNFDDPSSPLPSEEKPRMPKSKPIFYPNIRNKKEPLFDTPGNGVASLTAVWMNDPTGPLADDAMMLVASYYARKGNYVEADRYFQNLRELYPMSPHLQNAFVLGSHVKLMCYQGPEYETRPLQEAKLLKESTLQLYPDLDPARFREELAKIEEANAEVIWKRALFYEHKGKPRSCAVCCHDVITKFPKSQFAEKARAKLVQMGPEYESGSVFLTPIDDKKRPLYERILEPEIPEWIKNPSQAARRRKVVAKSQANANAKKDAAKDEQSESKDSVDDETTMPRDEEKPTTPSRRPRRLAPENNDQDMQPDDDSESKPTRTPASQAVFR